MPLYPRHAGKSKFGLSRIPVGVLDMLAVWFELRFGQKPLLLFGMLGVGPRLALCGIASISLLAADAGVRAIWTLIETCLILGSVLFATGLLGEQIAGQRAQTARTPAAARRARRAAAERQNGGRRGNDETL